MRQATVQQPTPSLIFCVWGKRPQFFQTSLRPLLEISVLSTTGAHGFTTICIGPVRCQTPRLLSKRGDKEQGGSDRAFLPHSSLHWVSSIFLSLLLSLSLMQPPHIMRNETYLSLTDEGREVYLFSTTERERRPKPAEAVTVTISPPVFAFWHVADSFPPPHVPSPPRALRTCPRQRVSPTVRIVSHIPSPLMMDLIT